MDFGQFYLEKLNAVIGELSKEKITLQCQLEFVIKKHEILEQEFKEISEKLHEKEDNLRELVTNSCLLEKEIEKLKKKLNKNQAILESENGKSLNTGEIIERTE